VEDEPEINIEFPGDEGDGGGGGGGGEGDGGEGDGGEGVPAEPSGPDLNAITAPQFVAEEVAQMLLEEDRLKHNPGPDERAEIEARLARRREKVAEVKRRFHL
jgi:hypothetical protein